MRIGPLIMLANAMVAFSLNVAAVFLVAAAGGLVLTLAGVFKGKSPSTSARRTESQPPPPPLRHSPTDSTCLTPA
jgi:hypothetical protein